MDTNIKLGICAGFDYAEAAKQAGFQFIEGGVGGVLKPSEGEDAFLPILEQIATSALPCEALNGFIPAHLKITGPDANLVGLETYCATAFERARRAGVRVIVFGSGGARKVPEGFDFNRATQQIIEFLKLIAPEAARQGVIVAIEPLGRAESNIINTVAAGAAIARAVDSPAIRLLVDAYHWASECDSVENIIANGDLLAHAHIATYAQRLLPGMEFTDFAPFLDALRTVNYSGRLSIESGGDKTPENLLAAYRGLGGVMPNERRKIA